MNLFRYLVLCVGVLGAAFVGAEEFPDARAFADECRKRGEAAEVFNLPGNREGWLFLGTELDHLGTGDFWKEEPFGGGGAKDPVKVIAAYKEELEALGVDLVLVPVPAKAAVYPEKLWEKVGVDEGVPVEGSVFATKSFYDELRAAGVEVVDLEPVFRKARRDGTLGKVYCEQDAHWSPEGAELAAKEVFGEIGNADWLKSVPKVDVAVGEPENLKIKGDLVEGDLKDTPAETVVMRRAGGGRMEPLEKDGNSPVLLLGDSHLLVFTDGGGDFHTKGAGFRDHLQARLGFATDVVANRASGEDVARSVLAGKARRDPGYWKKKKLVVWLFSARGFTQGKWREIPAQP